MDAVRSESRLFHAIVVVGLSFASTECGSAGGSTEDDAGGDSSAAAASMSDGSTLEATGATFGPGDAGPTTPASDAAPCTPDASSSDASPCVWPVYV